jgi:hypothetical protein
MFKKVRILLSICIFFVLVVGCLSKPKPPVEIPPKNPNDPLALAPGVTKKVLIIGITIFACFDLKKFTSVFSKKNFFYLNSGGGLSGLSAALELAERGYSVTIKEHLLGASYSADQLRFSQVKYST